MYYGEKMNDFWQSSVQKHPAGPSFHFHICVQFQILKLVVQSYKVSSKTFIDREW